jgi:dihydrofolate synthase/folylpolyglutamate synthase
MKMPEWPVPLGSKPIDLGLDRIKTALERLDNPHKKLSPVIHIAGTNGKGSTLSLVKSILNKAGFKCNLYSSPHLVDFNERIVVKDKMISDSKLNEALQETKEKCEDLNLTFFEGTTLAAIVAFSKVNSDFTLLETGMGGRLDATNIMGLNDSQNPALNIITKISKDHSEFLGEKVEQIAFEKACIMKKGTHCVIAKQEFPEVNDVIAQHSKKIGSITHFYGEKFSLEKDSNNKTILNIPEYNYREEIESPKLLGDHQFENIATAVYSILKLDKLLSLNITVKNIADGIKAVRWPARLQEIIIDEVPYFLDGGHNEDAAKALNSFIKKKRSAKFKTNIIISMLKRKNAKDYLNNLLSDLQVDNLILTEINSEESYSSEDLSNLYHGDNIKNKIISNNLDHALRIASKIDNIENHKNFNIICGSLYLAGEVLEKYPQL